ncbi:MAG: PEP-CTERM sorting domain-containing protein [Gemmatimonadota bacterium]
MMKSVRSTLVLGTMLAIGLVGSLTAQTVVTPSNNYGWTNQSWYWDGSSYSNTGSGSTTAITSTYARGGLGSAEISMDDNLNTESDFYRDFTAALSLSSLTSVSYDWYRSSSSTTGGLAAPAFAFYLANDPNYLIYEPYYNMTIPGNAPLDQWITETGMLNGIWWFTGNGTGNCSYAAAYQSLSAFNTQCYGGNAMVAGVNVYMGFSGPGSFRAAFDNVQYSFDDEGTTYNFEPDPRGGDVVPEPATLTLLASGLVGMAAARRRKQQTRA